MADMRSQLEKLNSQLSDNLVQLKQMASSFEKLALAPGQEMPALKNLNSTEYLDAVLACDTLSSPPPRWDRPEPCGKYDQFLCMEVFYNFLKNLPAEFDGDGLEDCAFTPEIISVRKACTFLELYIRFIQRPELEMVCKQSKGNKAMELALHADELLLIREKAMRKMVKIAQEGDGRRNIIAGGIALLLQTGSKGIPDGFADEVAAKFRASRQKLNDLLNREMTPEQVLESRRQVLAEGLPGDINVKAAWMAQQGGN
jgi:hypothetical protein